MKSGAWALLVALVVGFLGGWILRSPHDQEGPGSNPAVDSALIVAPLEAKVESLQTRVAATLATVGDSTKKYKDRADSLRQALVDRRRQRASRVSAQSSQPTASLATDSNNTALLSETPGDTLIPTIIDTTGPDTAVVVGPQTYEECMEDIATVEEESYSLRDAITSCEADVERLQGDLTAVTMSHQEQFLFRRDTFPDLIKKARLESKPCKEDWVLFRVSCSTSGWIKFGAGVVTGIAVTR